MKAGGGAGYGEFGPGSGSAARRPGRQPWSGGGERCKPVCKPDSVPTPGVGDGHPSWMLVARHLVRSDPGPGTSSPWTPTRPSLFDLAPDGVYLAGRSPGRRWALTPPFHRCRDRCRGCVLSVALSFGSPRLDVIQRPALWSPDFPQAANRPRPSDRLAPRVYLRDAISEFAGPGAPDPLGGGGHPFRLTDVHPF